MENVFTVVTEVEARMPLYVTTVGYWDQQEPTMREYGFPDFQWIQCVSGQGELIVEGRRYLIGPGQGMLLFPHVPHQYRSTAEPWGTQWICFNGKQLAEMMYEMNFVRSEVYYISNPDLTRKRIFEVLSILQSTDPIRNFEASSVAYQLLLDLYKYASGAEIRSKKQHIDQLAPVLAFIEQHYNRDLSLAELAGQLDVSPQYTCLLFQQTLGIRPFEYVTKFRLRKAKELLLQETSLDVKEVARRVGYGHPSYFIKLFKQQEGFTPQMFRRIHG